MRFSATGARPLSTRLLLCAGSAAVAAWTASGACAQTPAARPAADETVAEVIVTSSRIQNFTAPSPVTQYSTADLEARAVTRVSTALFELPSMRPVQNAGSSTNIGGAFINLRSLGQQRNLTLVDGRRVVASQLSTNSVDANVIPSALVARIDVVTTGASAAWGSDAVSGVTNFILKKDLEGFEGNVQYGSTTHHDNREASASLAWGSGFSGGKGHVEIAGEYNNLYDTPVFSDRDWTSARYLVLTPATIGGVTYARAILAGTTLSAVTPGGLITGATATVNNAANNAAALANFRTTVGGAPVTGTTFNAAGQPVAYAYGTNVGSSFQTGGDGPWPMLTQPLAAPLERKSIYAHAGYDLSDTTKLFAEASYANSYTSPTPYIPIWNPNSGDTPLAINSGNPYLPASIQATMTSKGIASINLGRLDTELGSYINETTVQTGRFAVGADGEFNADWRWNAYYTHGQTKYESYTRNNLVEPNFRAAIDVVRDASGAPICRINSTAAADIAITSVASYQGLGAAKGCLPLNPFGAGSITKDVAKYVTGDMFTLTKFYQDVVEGSVQGSPMATWAGPVETVVGVGYRREAVLQDSDATSQLTTTAYPGGAYQFGNSKPIKKANGDPRSLDVKEAFGEIVVPLAVDAPFARSLKLNAAARYTDYSTSGAVKTWKVGATYEPTEDVLFRATASRDIRAANLSELYAGSALAGGQITDYDTRVTSAASGLQYVALTIAQGNNALQPEVANSVTVGAVLHPKFIPRLNISIDAYRLKLENQIATLGGQNVINSCFGKNTAPLNASLCSLITRDPTSNRITSISNTQLNIAGTRTQGIDMQADYRIPLGDDSNLSLRITGSYVDKFVVNNGLTVTDFAGSLAGAGVPKYRVNYSATYERGPLSAFVTGRYIDKAKFDNTFNRNGVTTDIYDNDVPSRFYVDGSVSWRTNKDATVYIRATNIFDKDPPIVPGNQLAPATSIIYDQFGRTISAGVRFKY